MFFQRPAVRTLVALIISVFFLAIQIEYKPYGSAEHNKVATLACTQITVTLLMVALPVVGLPLSDGVGVLCILLNVVIVPLVLLYNARRLKHRSEVFSALSLAHGTSGEPWDTDKDGNQEADQIQFLNTSHFMEAWKAGKKSERAVFTAALRWIDIALERPVSHHRWAQILFVLEQLPLLDPARGGAQYGASQTLVCHFVWLNMLEKRTCSA